MLHLPPDIDSAEFIRGLTDQEAIELAEAIKAQQHRAKFYKFEDLFPEAGPFRRSLYPRHMEFFSAGKTWTQRCFMAANRVGKTICGGYEFTCHVTGLYPDWWDGYRFHKPVSAWAAGDTNETTRDIVQKVLFGEVAWLGNDKAMDESGLIPVGLLDLGNIKWKGHGTPDLVDTVKVQHVSGGWSSIGLKSYQQGRKAFQGTEQDLIWVDEEPPLEVYTEMLIRTMTTNGRTMLTYTPLEGLTGTVLQFLPEELRPPDEVLATMT